MATKKTRIIFHVAKRWFDMYLTGAPKSHFAQSDIESARNRQTARKRLLATSDIH